MTLFEAAFLMMICFVMAPSGPCGWSWRVQGTQALQVP